ncbi:MAG: hypothetical protein AAF479_09620 [Pseudomonadota bacterium]
MAVKLPKDPSFRIGALVVIAVGFIASALLRAGEVVAKLPEGGDDGFGNPIAKKQKDAEPIEVERVVVGPPELIAEIKELREKLNAREEALSKREMKLRILEKRMKERLQDMRDARERLAATAALVDDAAGKDVRRLAEMYQQMKPKKAGEIFNEMAASFAAGFIAEMRPDAAALVLANMDAAKAYAVSLLIAGRNIKQPTAENTSN